MDPLGSWDAWSAASGCFGRTREALRALAPSSSRLQIPPSCQDDLSQYTTFLAVSAIAEEKRHEAERIAKHRRNFSTRELGGAEEVLARIHWERSL